MGADNSKPKRLQINVATLNYSGIMVSPYQFHQFDSQAENLQSRNQTDQIEQQMLKKQQKEQQIQLNLIMQQLTKKSTDDSKPKKQSRQKLKPSQKFDIKFDFGDIDQRWQLQRYSPLYVPTCGIKNKINLMNQKQFREQWVKWKDNSKNKINAIYEQWLTKYKLNQNKPNLTESIEIREQRNKKNFDVLLNNVQDFDFLIYYVILKQIYKKSEDRQQLQNNFRLSSNTSEKFLLDAKLYKNNRKSKFIKSFLDEAVRVQKTISLMDNLNVDIFFLQQTTQHFLNQIQKRKKDIRIVRHCRRIQKQIQSASAILIRQNQSKFPKLRSLLQQNSRFTNNITLLSNPDAKIKKLTQQQISKQMNLNNDTVVQFLYNLILICPHLTSKKTSNPKQIEQMKSTLKFLKQSFPDCHIILAGDLNCQNYLRDCTISIDKKQNGKDTGQKKQVKFNIIPTHEFHSTTNKKRTRLQCQQEKANQKSKGVKDYILSDLQITDGKIILAQNEKVLIDCNVVPDKQFKLPLLPSNAHPYDHFLVFGKVIIDEGNLNNFPLQHVTDFSYRYKYDSSSLTNEQLKDIQQKIKNIRMPN